MYNDLLLQSLVDRLTSGTRDRMIAMNRASWEHSTTGSVGAGQLLAALTTEYRTHHADASAFAELREARSAAAALGANPTLQRQLLMLYQTYLTNQTAPGEAEELVQCETNLRQIFTNFRATLDGAEISDNQLADVLRTERNTARRQEAWLASKGIGPIAAEQVRGAARLRNQLARRLGFRDHFAMVLATQEIDETDLFKLLADLHEVSDAAFTAEKGSLDEELSERYSVPVSELMPWHYSDPFFQKAPTGAGGPELEPYFATLDVAAVSVDYFDRIGLEVRDILARSDLYERPSKAQNAFSFNLDRMGDIRILCNLTPTKGWMATQLHELGHAVYDKYIDPGIPWLLRRPPHSLTTEAIAMLFGRLTNNATWLSEFAGLPADKAAAAAAWLHRQERRNQLIFSRWGMVMVHFERALYADPDQDLGTLWWNLVERFQRIRRPEVGDRSFDWAAKIHVALYPVYYHSYILGELTASQLQAHLEQRLGATWPLSDEVGAWLWKRIFRPGNLLPWHDRIEVATGERLNPSHFVAQFVAE